MVCCQGFTFLLSWWKRTPDWNLTVELEHVSTCFQNDNVFVDQTGGRSLQAEAVQRVGESRLPRVTTHGFETFTWRQQRNALAAAANPAIEAGGIHGGEIVIRRVHTDIWLAASRNAEAWGHFDSMPNGLARACACIWCPS